MEALRETALLSVVGWSAGFNVYLTVAILGISSRMHWIVLPSGMDVLANPLIIGLAILIYLVQFVADKVPLVDSAWDSVHTFIRPAGAAAVGYLAGTQYGPLAQTTFAMLTGTLALNAHAVKASARVAINTSPEPFSNIAASLSEDSFIIFLFWFFTKHPWLAFAIVAALVVASFFFLRMMWRFVRSIFRWIWGKKNEPAPSAAVEKG